MNADEILDRAERSGNEVAKRKVARVRTLLAELEAQLSVADKRAEIARLRTELKTAARQVRRPARPLTTVVQAEIARLYVEERLTMHAVAARVDRSYSTVRRALQNAGVSFRAQGRSG